MRYRLRRTPYDDPTPEKEWQEPNIAAWIRGLTQENGACVTGRTVTSAMTSLRLQFSGQRRLGKRAYFAPVSACPSILSAYRPSRGLALLLMSFTLLVSFVSVAFAKM